MTDAPTPPHEDEGRMPLTDHLRELRTRLIRATAFFVLAFAVAYTYSDELFNLLQAPLQEAMSKVSSERATLAVTGLTEGFMTQLKVGALGAFFLACPAFFYEIWGFVAPGLYANERKLVIPFVFAFSALFILGAGFGYFVVFPYVFSFFLGSVGAGVVPVLSIEDFLQIASKLLLLFGLIFELPVLAFFLARLGIVHWQQMRDARKYAIVLIFILGAILTPPDPVSQVLVAVPLMGLYEVGIWVARLARPGALPAPAAETQEG